MKNEKISAEDAARATGGLLFLGAWVYLLYLAMS